MSLILPPWYFNYCTDNQSTPSMSDPGTACVLGVSNADDATTELLPALAHDVHRIVLAFARTSESGIQHNILADLMTDPAGGTSWSELISDLVAGGGAPGSTSLSASVMYDFPLFIPAGSSIGLRGRTSHTADPAPQVSIWAFGEPSRPDMWWCGQGVESLGLTPASSKGTDITSGTAGWGSWTSVGSATARRFGAIQFGTNNTDNVSSSVSYFFEVGYSSVKLPGFPKILLGVNTSEATANVAARGSIFCDIPAGTQMQVRGYASGAGKETHNVGLYGVY